MPAYLLLATGLWAGCAGRDLAAPDTGSPLEGPQLDRSVRVVSLEVVTFPGIPDNGGALRLLTAGDTVASIVQVRALDKKGRPVARVEVTSESVDWWPGLPSPPPDPGAQTWTTDETGTVTFTLIYPQPMLGVVTWRATAGQAMAEIGLNIAPAGDNPACTDYFGQYTPETFPSCYE